MADYSVKLNVDNRAALDGIRQVQDRVERLTDVFTSLRRVAGQVSIAALVTGAAQLADTLRTVSQVSGIALKNVGDFATAVGQSGGNGLEAARNLGEFSAKMDEARMGSADLQTALRQVGVSVDDLRTLGERGLLEKVIGGLAGIDDSSKRTRLSVKLLGEEFKKVDIRTVSGSYNQLAGQTRDTSHLKDASDAVRNLTLQFRRFQDALLQQIQPITKVAAQIDVSIEAFKRFLDIIILIGSFFLGGAIAKGLGLLSNAIFKNVQYFKSLTKTVEEFGTSKAAQKRLKELTDLSKTAGSNIKDIAFKQFGDKFSVSYASTLVAPFAKVVEKVGQKLVTFGDFIKKQSTIIGILSATVYGARDAIGEFYRAITTGEAPISKFERAIYLTLQTFKGIPDAISAAIAKFDEFFPRLKQYIEAAGQLNLGTQFGNRIKEALDPGAEALRAIFTRNRDLERAMRESAAALDIDNQSIAEGYEEQLKLRDAIDASALALTQMGDALFDNVGAIRRRNAALAAGLRLEQDALTPGKRIDEDQLNIRRRLNDIEFERIDAIVQLNQQIRNLRREEAAGIEDPNRAKKIAMITDAIAATNKAYLDQKRAIELTQPRIDALRMLDAARAKDMENLTESINRRISAEGRLRDILRGVDEQTRAARRAREDMGITIYETQIREIARQNQDAMEAAQRDFAGEFSDFDILSPQQIERFNTGMDQITSKFRELTRIQGENLGRSRTWTQGWADAFKDFEESATNAATIARDVFTTFTSSIEGALDSFVRNGKMKFKDFVRDVARDLLSLAVKIQFRQLLLASGTMKPGGLFGSLFSGLGGGGGPATLAAIPGFATGGYIPPGRIGMVGERGPELISGPAQITPMDRMGMGSGTVTNNYYTINAVDARSVAQLFSENRISLLGAVRAAEKSLPGGGR